MLALQAMHPELPYLTHEKLSRTPDLPYASTNGMNRATTVSDIDNACFSRTDLADEAHHANTISDVARAVIFNS